MAKSNFNHRAHHYENEAVIQLKYGRKLIDKVIKFTSPEFLKIADLGSGSGILSREILQRRDNCHILNIDQSTEMLKIAQNKINSRLVDFFVGSLPPDDNYDVIISNFALQWYDNLSTTLNSMEKKLKPNGIMAICLPISGSFSSLQKIFAQCDVIEHFFNFPQHKLLLETFAKSKILFEELTEENQEFPNTLEFFKHLHRIGANQTGLKFSPIKLKKIIQLHDELFNDKIIVNYKILTIILKKIQK